MPRHRKKKNRQPTVSVEAAAAPEAEGGEQPFTTQASPKLKVQLWGDDNRITNPMADLDASPVAAADSEYGDSPAGNSTADGIVEEPVSPPPETRAPEYDDLIHQIDDVKQRILAAQQITGQSGAVGGSEEGADTAAALVPRLQAQLRRKEQRLRELTAELDKAEDSNSRIQAKLQLLQSDNDAAAVENAELRGALDKLTYEVEEKEAAKPERAAASPSQLWEKSAELSKANKELEAELARSQQIADVRGKQVDKLATARKDALATLGQVTAERDELAKQLQRLQHGTPAAKRTQANAQLARDKAAAEQEAAELRGEVDNLRRQLSAARHKGDDQQDGQLAQSYELLKRDTALLRGEVEELTAENAGLRAEIAALRAAGGGGSESDEVAALRAELEEVKAAKAESDRHLRELRAANDMDLEALQRELQDEIQGDGTYVPAKVAEPESSDDDGREDGSESEGEVNPTPAGKEQPQASGQVADSPATEYSPVKARALNAEFEATTHQPDTPTEVAAQVDTDAKAEEEEEYVPAKKPEAAAHAEMDPLIAAISPRSNDEPSRDPRAESPRSSTSRGSGAAGAGKPSSPRSTAASSPRSQASPRTTRACDHYLIYHKRMAASTCKCGVCGKSISRMGQCYKCSKCKLKAHTECVTRTDGGEAYLPSPARS